MHSNKSILYSMCRYRCRYLNNYGYMACTSSVISYLWHSVYYNLTDLTSPSFNESALVNLFYSKKKHSIFDSICRYRCGYWGSMDTWRALAPLYRSPPKHCSENLWRAVKPKLIVRWSGPMPSLQSKRSISKLSKSPTTQWSTLLTSVRSRAISSYSNEPLNCSSL